MPGEPWTQTEVEILAKEYFEVLDAESRGEQVNKNAALRRAMAALPSERSLHTLKDRCYRISEELWKRDLPWVEGWKPPQLVGQSANSVNVSTTIWAAIEDMADGARGTVSRASDSVAPAEPQVRQMRMSDAEQRRAIEDVAQERLMAHFRALGWSVEDTHLNSPFDARATKGGAVQFLEAKGTTTAGETVLVTPGEVRWAREHPGQCVMGIVSDIVVSDGGVVESSSGTLRLVDWVPDDGDLQPTQFEWTPPV